MGNIRNRQIITQVKRNYYIKLLNMKYILYICILYIYIYAMKIICNNIKDTKVLLGGQSIIILLSNSKY